MQRACIWYCHISVAQWKCKTLVSHLSLSGQSPQLELCLQQILMLHLSQFQHGDSEYLNLLDSQLGHLSDTQQANLVKLLHSHLSLWPDKPQHTNLTEQDNDMWGKLICETLPTSCQYESVNRWTRRQNTFQSMGQQNQRALAGPVHVCWQIRLMGPIDFQKG